MVTATSNAVLENLFSLLGEQGAQQLRETMLVVVSERMAQRAAELGCTRVRVAASARDQDLLQALCTVSDDAA